MRSHQATEGGACAASEREMAELKAQRGAQEEGEKKANLCLPKLTLQKLGADDDIEHFLTTFERIVKQQGWPTEIWPTHSGRAVDWEGHGSLCRLDG